MKKKNLHWTAGSPEDFKYHVAFDFMSDLENLMDAYKISVKQLAKKSGVSAQIIQSLVDDPQDLTLIHSVKLSRALGNKVSLVLYEDGDSENQHGPVHPQVFATCWKNLKCPKDMFGFVTNAEKGA